MEKPVAINAEDCKLLNQIVNKHARCNLYCGFNRRYSPHIKFVTDKLKTLPKPFFINMNINAGQLEEDHWNNDPKIGGGRFISEGIHFMDLSNHLIMDEISTEIKYLNSGLKSSEFINSNWSTIIKYQCGSICNINYYENGNNSYPKETIIINTSKCTFEVNNFRKTTFYYKNSKKTFKTWSVDKGHKQIVSSFLNNKLYPTALKDLISTHQKSIAVNNSVFNE